MLNLKWTKAFNPFRFFALFFIGFANALIIPLSGSLTSIWLTEIGYNKTVIGLLSLVGIPFSLKIFWSPFINHFRLPFSKHAPRKGWLLFGLVGMIISIGSLSLVNPEHSFFAFLLALFLLSLFTGCLYMAGISYELESLYDEEYSLGSAFVITGYRLGLLCGGAGGLYLAHIWDWSFMLQCMAGLLILGTLLIAMLPEPFKSKRDREPFAIDFFWKETFIKPSQTFFQKPYWFILFSFILLFKCGNQLSKSMEGPFLLALNFNKSDLATAAKLWGFLATIAGAFLAGFTFARKNIVLSICYVSLLHAASLICYYILATIGKSYIALYLTVAFENFTGGMGMTLFISFLWKLCDKRYAAVQYVLLWSIFSLKADLMAFLGSLMATILPWPQFFLVVTTISLFISFLMLQMAQRKGQLTYFQRRAAGGAETQRNKKYL